MSDIETRPHALYRFFDGEGVLLYVGITHHPTGRWRQHRQDKPWWSEVRNITLEPFPCRTDVLAAERAAIDSEQPKWNADSTYRDARWISDVWDSNEHGTIASVYECRDAVYLSISHPDAASDDALLDLRAAIRDQHVGTKPLVLTLPASCQRGRRTALLFGGSDIEEWDSGRGFRFTARLRVGGGKRLLRVLDEHFTSAGW